MLLLLNTEVIGDSRLNQIKSTFAQNSIQQFEATSFPKNRKQAEKQSSRFPIRRSRQPKLCYVVTYLFKHSEQNR